jgi:membrane-associated phospholipid phosphatase
LHAAFPALAAMYAWRQYRPLAIGLLAWTACVWVAIVYLGEHYFVDALAGLVYAVVALAVVELVARRRARLARPFS